jgi:hypothetical protein
MNMRIIPRLLLPLLLTGCAGNGYISSTIHTVVGLDVSENPKTQVPHVRFGYVRSGLYYVPTGKSPGPDGTGTGESVKETPELVSEIFVNAKFLSSVTINEKFAIGEKAVASGAAEQAFASTAAQQVAQGAAGAASPITHMDAPVRGRIPELRKPTEGGEGEKPPTIASRSATEIQKTILAAAKKLPNDTLPATVMVEMDKIDPKIENQDPAFPDDSTKKIVTEPVYPRTRAGLNQLTAFTFDTAKLQALQKAVEDATK